MSSVLKYRDRYTKCYFKNALSPSAFKKNIPLKETLRQNQGTQSETNESLYA
jgi:hypothetical protein